MGKFYFFFQGIEISPVKKKRKCGNAVERSSCTNCYKKPDKT
jgi:hypothetical protein